MFVTLPSMYNTAYISLACIFFVLETITNCSLTWFLPISYSFKPIMHILFLVLMLTVNAAVFPRASVEDIEMDVFDDGPTVAGDAGIGAEFETPLFNFQNSACSLENTFAAKGLTIQVQSGLNYRLSVDRVH